MKIFLVGAHTGLKQNMEFYIEHALKSMNHQVEVFDYRKSTFFSRAKKAAVKERIKSITKIIPPNFIPFLSQIEQKRMNKFLYDKVVNFAPDLIIVLRGDAIKIGTLRKIKDKKIKIVNWLVDNPFLCLADNVYSFYDAIFIFDTYYIDLLYKKGAKRVEYLPCACSPKFHHPVELTEQEKRSCESEICFIGSHHSSREEILAGLKGFNLSIWGDGWGRAEDEYLKKSFQGESLSVEEWVKRYSAAKIVINIHWRRQSVRGVNMRCFEALACKSFIITDYVDDLPKVFKLDQEIVSFRNLNELKQKIKYYIQEKKERLRIAENGFLRVRAEHTYVHRLNKIFSVI